MVAGLHVGDALTNRLNNTRSFVAKDNGKASLRILARKGVGILVQLVSVLREAAARSGIPTCVAYTSIVNLNSDLVGLGRCNLNVLDAKLLACLPRNRRLASYGLLEVQCGELFNAGYGSGRSSGQSLR